MKKIIPIIAISCAGLMLTGCGYTIEKSEPNSIQTNIMEFKDHVNSFTNITEEKFNNIALNKYKLSIVSDNQKLLDDDTVQNNSKSDAEMLTKNQTKTNETTKNTTDNIIKQNTISDTKDTDYDISQYARNGVDENREIVKNNLRNIQNTYTDKNKNTTINLGSLSAVNDDTDVQNNTNNAELDANQTENSTNLQDDATQTDENNTINQISTLYSLSSDIENSSSEFIELKTKLVEAINETQNLITKVQNNEIELTAEERMFITEQTRQLKELGRQLSRSSTELAISLSDLSDLLKNENGDIDMLNIKYMVVLDNLINGNEMLENSLNSLNLINTMFNMNARNLPQNARGRVVYGFKKNNEPEIVHDYIIDENGNLQENLSEETDENNEENSENNQQNVDENEQNTNNATNVNTYQNSRFKSNIDTYYNNYPHNIDTFFNTALLDNEFMYGNSGYGYNGFNGYGYNGMNGYNPYIGQYAGYENQNRDNQTINQNVQNTSETNNNLSNNTTNSVDNLSNTQNKATKRNRLQKNIDTYRDESTPTIKGKFAKFKQSVKGFFSKLNPNKNENAKNPIFRFSADDKNIEN